MMEYVDKLGNKIICEDKGDYWLCKFNGDIKELISKEELGGFYDDILKATVGEDLNKFKGQINPMKIEVPYDMDLDIADTIMEKYKDDVTYALIMYVNKAPSHSNDLEDNEIIVYKDAILESD